MIIQETSLLLISMIRPTIYIQHSTFTSVSVQNPRRAELVMLRGEPDQSLSAVINRIRLQLSEEAESLLKYRVRVIKLGVARKHQNSG